MHPADIKASLHKKGSSLSGVARALKLSPSTVGIVVRGEGKSRRVAKRISDIVGIPVSTLWPGLYIERASAKARRESVASHA